MNHETRTHLDLFSGIAGFSLAARANGVRTIQFVEIDARCRDFLAKAWPGIPIWDDIRTFRWNMGESAKDGRQAGTQLHRSYDWEGPRQRPEPGGLAHAGKRHRGRWASQPQQGSERRIAPGRSGQQVWLLSAGVPCQPASRAGKQRGKDDDRWLWAEALRVFEAVRPAWAIFENPPGIEDLFEYGVQLEVDGEGNSTAEVGTVVDRDGRGIFSETLDAIQAQGYAVKTLGIPACSVGAPHRRERYWIICRRVLADGCVERRQQIARGASENEGEHAGWTEEGNHESSSLGQSDLAQSNLQRRSVRGIAAAATRYRDSAEPEIGTGGLGNPKQGGRERGAMPTGGPERSFGGSDRPIAPGSWDNFVWLPCADGKVRRAPDGLVSVADGDTDSVLAELGQVHRSALGALGNAIVWPVAARIIEAMIQSEESEPRGT